MRDEKESRFQISFEIKVRDMNLFIPHPSALILRSLLALVHDYKAILLTG